MASDIPRHRHHSQGGGAAYSDKGIRLEWGTTRGEGHALCDCGKISPEPLRTAAIRRAWVARHRNEVNAASG